DRGSRPMLQPNFTKGQLSSCSPILATSLGSLAHLAVSMATGKTQTSRRVRLNGSKPQTWFGPLGGRRGRNGYHGMLVVRSKHACPVDHCSRSKTHLALTFAPGSKGNTHRVAPALSLRQTNFSERSPFGTLIMSAFGESGH